MLVVEGISELIADATGRANGLVNIAMGVTVNPVVDAAIFDIVGQLYGEGSIDSAAAELWRHELE